MSFDEIEHTDLIVLWGSNAREAHPIFFHHVLRALEKGATLVVVDPRRTPTARWADLWLAPEIGTDIILANAIAREILATGAAHREFIERATTGFDAFAASVEPYTLDRAERETGIPATDIAELAHRYGSAERAVIGWTLGITEHRDAVASVLSLVNLALLTGHVGRFGSGLHPLRGQNNVQGGGDMGALPYRLPGFQDVENDDIRRRFDAAWQSRVPPRRGWNLTEMLDAVEHGDLRSLLVIGENPARSEANTARAAALLQELDCLVVQDLFLTDTAQLAHVVLPAAASWCESEGTVTNSERRVQRVRKAVDPPGEARDDLWILAELARRLGHDWGHPSASEVWDEVRSLSPIHRGMSYPRLEAMGGLRWPCPDETHPGTLFLHGRLWDDPVGEPRAPFHVVEAALPADELTDEFPIRLTTGRRLDSFNTGVQTTRYRSPLWRDAGIDLAPQDGERLELRVGEIVRVSSRRGSVDLPVRFDDGLRPGLAFMTIDDPYAAATNLLTIDATDPQSGTAEFKATAVRIDKLDPDEMRPVGVIADTPGTHH